MFSMIKKALAARAEKAMYENFPVDLGRFKRVAGYLEPKKLKRIAIAVVGGSAVLSLIGVIGRNSFYRAVVAREPKKQLEPIQEQLDELSEQNEALIRQNEALQEQLANAK